MVLEMKRQDMEELSQLLGLYERIYESREAGNLLKEVSERYRNRYKENILEKRNPRKAGRKRQYREDKRKELRKFREKGLTIREIARETGCSVGYVQGVLSEP